jgi:hypothetical protein|tara:strand:+ start:571 stop:1170 length:600 start_codon:yes stop_codon:yes gene_type:complete
MIDLQLFKNIMKEARHNADLLDSYSPNQFKSKENLINHVKSLNILDKDLEIVIFGAWYGSILIPAFCHHVKQITAVDIDDNVMRIAKNRLFKGYNVDFSSRDCFEWAEGIGKERLEFDTNLIINTSCEHMRPMKELNILNRIDAYFAFQSNNMFSIPGHTNCVNSIEEFKSQLPDNAKVLIEDEVTDDRGTRYTLIGKL